MERDRWREIDGEDKWRKINGEMERR